MGTELEDRESHERWLVVDLILKREMPELGNHSIQFCDPARPATHIRGVEMRRRWEIMLLPGEDALAMCQPTVLWQLLSRWITSADATLERPAAYTFHSVVAKGLRKGRLLGCVANACAHALAHERWRLVRRIARNPNLAWKLADVISGAAGEQLLDTYESERSPYVREFTETAIRLGNVIQATDAEAAKRHDAEMLARPQIFATSCRPAARMVVDSSNP